ncbi:MAG: hypothetical protein ICV60_00265 [Pyrinomonadaceae bacterium]|nr:hypothetical protein [Pyrinomonadaceae bacterium]
MRRCLAHLALSVCILSQIVVVAQAQGDDPAITATRVFGKITNIDAPSGRLTVKTDAGSVVVVQINTDTTFERVPPGETDTKKAVAINLTDISVGDGVYARGRVAEDRKSVPAQKVIVVSQSEIAQKQERERQEWRRRGLSGIIESLNPQTKEITVTARTAEGNKPVIIPVTDKVKMRRYAPDSVKFSDAKKSSFEELKVGDQLRAKGDKSTDGTHFSAEEIVTGAFRTNGGTIKAINPQTGEIQIEDIQTKQALTIVINKDSTLKRIPDNFMQMMGGGGGPGAAAGGPGGGGAGGGAQAQQRPAGSPAAGQTSAQGAGNNVAPSSGGGQGAGRQGAPGAGGGGQGAGQQGAGPGAGGGPGGGFDIQRIIDNLPPVTLAELKPGDMVLLSSTKGADPSRATAITLVSGVGPLFTMMQARQGGPPNRPPNLGTINLGIGGP